jgi:hypothetical protein
VYISFIASKSCRNVPIVSHQLLSPLCWWLVVLALLLASHHHAFVVCFLGGSCRPLPFACGMPHSSSTCLLNGWLVECLSPLWTVIPLRSRSRIQLFTAEPTQCIWTQCGHSVLFGEWIYLPEKASARFFCLYIV